MTRETSSAQLRDVRASDLTHLERLLPRLAEFEVSTHRNPDDLWAADLANIRAFVEGRRPDCFCRVAVDADDTAVGVILVRMQPEPMSRTPSAHLEAIAVAEHAEGRGLGRALLAEAETEAHRRGARSMTLHVFTANERARRVYERNGYESELVRCIKWLA